MMNTDTATTNKMIFSANLKKYMQLNHKSRMDISAALDVSYNTFTDWVKGKKYPRIDKIEALANYFGISKSDLIEVHPEIPSSEEKIKTELLSVIIRLHDDSKFLAVVETVHTLNPDQLEALNQFLTTFSKE